MAGPGGGPPRRSHTKSRKGCIACKRRHIRCDENFPQCRNCTKHKIRCPYHDLPVPDDRSAPPDKPDLKWTAELEGIIERWRLSGIFPLPDLNINPAPSPHNLSNEDLRLIYHVAAISHQLDTLNASYFTLWTRHIPTIIQLGASHGYVLRALLAFSANHMAGLTGCPLVHTMAHEYRGTASKGLQEAIDSFSPESFDAILAASLVLSWQANDWRSWNHISRGISQVMEAMNSWKYQSHCQDLLADICVLLTSFPATRPLPSTDRLHDNKTEIFERIQQQLDELHTYLRREREDAKPIAQLINYFQCARKMSSSLCLAQQFDRLRPLRVFLFWLPVMCLQKKGVSPGTLVTIAHYYSAACSMEQLFPDIGAAFFGRLTIEPLNRISSRLSPSHIPNCDLKDAGGTAIALLKGPLETAGKLQRRMGFFAQPRSIVHDINEPLTCPQMTPLTTKLLPFPESPAPYYSPSHTSSTDVDSNSRDFACAVFASASSTQTQYLIVPSASPYLPQSPVSYCGSIDANDPCASTLVPELESEYVFTDSDVPLASFTANQLQHGFGTTPIRDMTPSTPSWTPSHSASSSAASIHFDIDNGFESYPSTLQQHDLLDTRSGGLHAVTLGHLL